MNHLYNGECIQDGDGHAAGGSWRMAYYETSDPRCSDEENAELVVIDYGNDLGVFIYNNNIKIKTILNFNDAIPMLESKDLLSNDKWKGPDFAYTNGRIKHGEFISLGQSIISEGKKARVWIDVKGWLRFELHFDPCSPNLPNIINHVKKNMNEKKFFNPDYNSNSINGSIFNLKYLDKLVKIKVKQKEDEIHENLINIYLKFKGEDNTYSYYKLDQSKQDKDKDCNYVYKNDLFIFDEISDKNLNIKKTNKSIYECGKICNHYKKDCLFYTVENNICKIYDNNASKYIRKLDNKTTTSLSQGIYIKTCSPYDLNDSNLNDNKFNDKISETTPLVLISNHKNIRNFENDRKDKTVYAIPKSMTVTQKRLLDYIHKDNTNKLYTKINGYLKKIKSAFGHDTDIDNISKEEFVDQLFNYIEKRCEIQTGDLNSIDAIINRIIAFYAKESNIKVNSQLIKNKLQITETSKKNYKQISENFQNINENQSLDFQEFILNDKNLKESEVFTEKINKSFNKLNEELITQKFINYNKLINNSNADNNNKIVINKQFILLIVILIILIILIIFISRLRKIFNL